MVALANQIQRKLIDLMHRKHLLTLKGQKNLGQKKTSTTYH